MMGVGIFVDCQTEIGYFAKVAEASCVKIDRECSFEPTANMTETVSGKDKRAHV